LEKLAKDMQLISAIGEAVLRSNKTVPVIEKVRKFVISHHSFTVENGQMTPTLKIRRHAILREFRVGLEALY
ncbi:MAG: long-chain fatty acid--CoA ligase, partial [Rhodospirillales bacterium]